MKETEGQRPRHLAKSESCKTSTEGKTMAEAEVLEKVEVEESKEEANEETVHEPAVTEEPKAEEKENGSGSGEGTANEAEAEGEGEGEGDEDKKSDGDKAATSEPEGSASLKDLILLVGSEEKHLYLVFACGVLFALINGLGDPLMIVLFSESLSALTNPEDALRVMSELAILFTILGGVLQIAASIQYFCFTYVAKRLSGKLRKKWLSSLLRQDIGWFDENDPSELPGKMSSSVVLFEEGVGAKLGLGIQFFSGFLAGMIIALVYNVYVSLITFAALPLVAGSGAFLVKVNTEAAEQSEKAYSKANALAYESFKGLKTLLSFNGLDKMESKFMQATKEAKKAGIKRSLRVGFANGSMLSTFIIMYFGITIFGGWALSHQIEKNGCDPSGAMSPRFRCTEFNLSMEMDGTSIFIALMSIAIGGQALGQVATSVDAFTQALKAVKPGMDVIKRKPTIDIEEEGGEKPEKMNGHIVLENVNFSYPTRKDAMVCKNFSLEILPGTTLALVGESGCGKSTITQLLQRYYDPLDGSILVDGHHIKDLNLEWLRQNIAIVSQEPKLFSGTVAENIAAGAISAGKKASRDDIEKAAKMANAHGFIMEFNDGYDTNVGLGGSQMSGGQKQRIAIARALVKNPQILLLDEATSALDNKSEKIVQEALDTILAGGKNRTTIVIAHRLSTIRTADVIGYIKDGQIIEKGSHEELMKIDGGYYRALVEKQEIEKPEHSGTMSKSSSKVDLTSVNKKVDNSTKEETGKSDKVETEKEVDEYKVPWSKIWNVTKPDMKYYLGGAFSAMIAGSLYPFWGYMFAKMITVFFNPIAPCVDNAVELETNHPSPQSLGFSTCSEYFKHEADDLWKEALFLSYFWIIVAVLTLISNATMFLGFGAASERLCFRVRNLMFSSYLRQEPGYFDMPENAVGSIASRLANEAALLKAKTGEPLQYVLITLFGCVGGIVLAAIFTWQIALMAMGVLPILAVAMSIQVQIMMGQTSDKKSENPEIGGLTGETLNSMRTVTSFGLQKDIVSRHDVMLKKDKMKMNALCRKSIGFGLSFSLQHWAWSLLLWFGAWIIDNSSNVNFEDFSIAIFAFFFGLFGMSMAGSGATDTKAAVNAISTIFRLLDRLTKIDPKSTAGVTPKDKLSGEISLNSIEFTYPARTEQTVCDDLHFEVVAGEKIGVVGSSGSGKSTIIQLIERFYDPSSGQVLFDKVASPNINYSWLHEQMGMVGQEPVLFNGTIAENIGFTNNSRDDIIEAAKLANADAFIKELPSGYDTDIGPGGTLLSGGQKQRVAIARALISKPKILLLDEATSALDATSEAVVQETLDNLMKKANLTTLMIAHRLSTVRHMDKIIVVENGKVVESGNHDELVSKEGVYYGLVQASGH